MKTSCQRTRYHILFLACLFWTSLPGNYCVEAQNSSMELYILQSFVKGSKVADGGKGFTDWENANNLNYCTWEGVTCSSGTSTIVKLDFSRRNLSSPVSTSICSLPDLREINISNNHLNEEFPTELFNCNALTSLDVSFNDMWGPLPEVGWSKLGSTLTKLDLSHNQFSGAIPAAIAESLPLLHYFNVWSNLFTDAIPSNIGNLTHLVNLTISWNPFTSGCLPDAFSKLTRLVWFTCAACRLKGTIPLWLNSLTSIQFLDLSYNELSGSIPAAIFTWPNIRKLELYYNSLTGPIPVSVGNISTLTDLDLSCNFLNGPIPPELGKLSSLRLLHLWNNSVSGEIPPILGNLTDLKILQLFENFLTGTIPQDLGRGSNGALEIFDVSTNYLKGGVPPFLCEGGKLWKLIFFSNYISGVIPEEYGRCQSLIRVRLGNNQLQGQVPLGLWGLPLLFILELHDNHLNGQIASSELHNAVHLTELQISGNAFTGALPDSIGQLVSLQSFGASSNQFSGSIPEPLQLCYSLQELDLQKNAFTGSIPGVLGNLGNLTSLDLSGNQLSGSIPSSLGTLSCLFYLNFAFNHLTGDVPMQLANLQFSISTFNLSFNNLSGLLPFPLAGAFTLDSFIGNPHLCIPELHQVCSKQRTASDQRFIIACIFMAILVVMAFIFCCLCKRMHDNMQGSSLKDEDQWVLTPFERIDFDKIQLLKCLEDEDNVIGRGGSGKVYVARLENGRILAVKKLWVEKNRREHPYYHDFGFKAEVDMMGKVRHSNIVKLLCCCTNGYTRLLVYEYMENGSLGDVLHNGKGKPSTHGCCLAWQKRLKIALGAARGLAYLHHDCMPPIVHCDVKSNNILLDADYEAHISDFGLAKVLPMPSSMDSCADKSYSPQNITGSAGYIAPEHGYGLRVTEKSDVYGFGVVLLELLTGKRPTEPEFGGGVDIVRWLTGKLEYKQELLGCLLLSDSSSVKGISLDLQYNQEVQEMLVVLKLALRCASTLPCQRPSMREVVDILALHIINHLSTNVGSKLSKSPKKSLV